MVFTSFGTLSLSVTLLLKQTRPQRGESGGCTLQCFIRRRRPRSSPISLYHSMYHFDRIGTDPFGVPLMGKGTTLPFHLPKFVKLIPFDTPEARKRSPSQAEHPSVDQVHSYGTRSTEFFYLPQCRTNIRKFSISFQGPRFFNSLSFEIRNATSTASFCCKLKAFLLS